MRGGSQRQSFSIRMAAPTVQRDIGGSSASAERGYVKLNVGGTLHVTTRATLTAHGGFIVIDRDGRYFHHVLNFLRDGVASLPTEPIELEALLVEARYYLLDGLAAQVSSHLRTAFLSACHIPMILDERDERRLLASTLSGPPAVRFSYNRQNNRFSYKTGGEDALLKNIELFDKLAARFRGRVLYAKDCCGRGGDICAWYFYGRGRLLAEVCCTALVYTADRKQIKIEFPEARLFEDNMNLLLYEPGATLSDDGSGRAAGLSGEGWSDKQQIQSTSPGTTPTPPTEGGGEHGVSAASLEAAGRIYGGVRWLPPTTIFPMHDADVAAARTLGEARRSVGHRDSAI